MKQASVLIGIAALCAGGAVQADIVPTKTGAPALQSKLRQGLTPAEAKELLALHNEARAAVREASPPIPAMTWSPELAGRAQAYVDRLIAGEIVDGKPLNGHDMNRTDGSGENLAAPQSGDLAPARAAIDGWVRERVANFAYKPFPRSDIRTAEFEGSGHYTQVVWSRSTELGCGAGSRVMDRQNGRPDAERYYIERVIICRYLPSGNVTGPNLEPTQYPYYTAPNPQPGAAGTAVVAATGVAAPAAPVVNFRTSMLAVNNKGRTTALAWDDALEAKAAAEAKRRIGLPDPRASVMAGEQLSLMEAAAYPDPATGFATDMEWNKAWKPAAIAEAQWARIGCATTTGPVKAVNQVLTFCYYGRKL